MCALFILHDTLIYLTVVDLGEGLRSTEGSDESDDEELAALDVTEY